MPLSFQSSFVPATIYLKELINISFGMLSWETSLFFQWGSCTRWLVGYEFPDQGLKPGPGSESTEPQILNRLGIPGKRVLR